jgi:spore maturation protein CgeB
VAVYGRDAAQTAFGEAFWREHQRSRVVFVPKPPSWAPCRYWSNRIYLATATGTPAVAGWTEGLEGHFQDGRDLLFYRTQQELESAIDLLLSDTEARIRIGTAGRRRTLEDHTYAKRSAELMAAIFGRNP